MQQVNTAVSEMDGVTQQNAAMVEQATAAARSLSEEADELARQVARFTLGQAHHASGSSGTVHTLQARAAQAGREIARNTRRRVGAAGGGAAVTQDDWSEF